MEPIDNRSIRVKMRLQNEEEAAKKEEEIRKRLDGDISRARGELSDRLHRLQKKKLPEPSTCLWMMFGGGILTELIFNIFLVGAILGLIIFLFQRITTEQNNTSVDEDTIKFQTETEKKIEHLKADAEKEITALHLAAEEKTRKELARYDAEVKRNCLFILDNRAKDLEGMLKHTVEVFQRMISHADTSSSRKFVVASLIFKVELYRILYSYESTYTNPLSDYNFEENRYRNLSGPEECEGLAQALAKLTIQRVRCLYPPNSIHITVSHVDAEVTLHFRAANKNYIPPKDIF